MREFLSDPLFWLRETLRWHWWEILIVTGAIWTTLALALLALSMGR